MARFGGNISCQLSRLSFKQLFDFRKDFALFEELLFEVVKMLEPL
jgi:hypothetical protein